jgi:hypothetical protein
VAARSCLRRLDAWEHGNGDVLLLAELEMS